MPETLIVPTDAQVLTELENYKESLDRPSILKRMRNEKSWSLSDTRLKRLMSEKDSSRSRYIPQVPCNVDFLEADSSLLATYCNALTQYPSEFPALLNSASLQTLQVSETTDLPPPALPRDALGAQLRFYENHKHQLFILYGRGEYDYAVGHNTQMAMLHSIVQLRIFELLEGKSRPLSEEDQITMNSWSGVQTFFEFYEAAGKKAGLPANDVGRQFEAEYGVNPLVRRTPEQNDPMWRTAYDRAKESIHKKYTLPVLRQLSQHPKTRGTVPLDSNGEPIYDPKVYGRFAFIITKLCFKLCAGIGEANTHIGNRISADNQAEVFLA
ncbi:uncharacterized protein EV420DRAFT_1480889 [Desarmillaria tabescens]|uniref:Uncharacterized protein n=1 Tax=Armillaria tabescens TaxID=1929756 RepID=A0AA39KBY0_ARMTA|nr:uncharacterized protein EV420DRAFT_1480889 [Desarmillaria tabescens]KAK0457014.1 hypothetical protein EV420DRAFT_1480889 [Desarmillaria tabescens]